MLVGHRALGGRGTTVLVMGTFSCSPVQEQTFREPTRRAGAKLSACGPETIRLPDLPASDLVDGLLAAGTARRGRNAATPPAEGRGCSEDKRGLLLRAAGVA